MVPIVPSVPDSANELIQGYEIFCDVTKPKLTVAKAIGEMTSSLAKPILDYKKINALEECLLFKTKESERAKVEIIKQLKEALVYGNLSEKAQLRLIDIVEGLIK